MNSVLLFYTLISTSGRAEPAKLYGMFSAEYNMLNAAISLYGTHIPKTHFIYIPCPILLTVVLRRFGWIVDFRGGGIHPPTNSHLYS